MGDDKARFKVDYTLLLRKRLSGPELLANEFIINPQRKYAYQK